MPIEVIFMACSLLNGQQCREVHLGFYSESLSHFECMLYGQSAIAKWTMDNPNWILKRGYKCGRAGQFAKV